MEKLKSKDEKHIKDIVRLIHVEIENYYKNKHCYSLTKSTYKKVFNSLFEKIIEKAFIGLYDNPHYKCSAPMKLYDWNVLEYYKKIIA